MEKLIGKSHHVVKYITDKCESMVEPDQLNSKLFNTTDY